MLIEQAMEFCLYLGIEVGRINENGKLSSLSGWRLETTSHKRRVHEVHH